MIPQEQAKVNDKITQDYMVIEHLRKFGSITPLTAQKEYGIMRLGAIIFRLRKAGFDIRTEMEAGKNRFGRPTHYARYTAYRKDII